MIKIDDKYYIDSDNRYCYSLNCKMINNNTNEPYYKTIGYAGRIHEILNIYLKAKQMELFEECNKNESNIEKLKVAFEKEKSRIEQDVELFKNLESIRFN